MRRNPALLAKFIRAQNPYVRKGERHALACELVASHEQKEGMTGQKRQEAHFPATRNADEPPRGKSVTPHAVPTVSPCLLFPGKPLEISSLDSCPVSLSLAVPAISPLAPPSIPNQTPPLHSHSLARVAIIRGGAAL
jgi:hypothetical protein